MNSFSEFGLTEPILRALAQEKYVTPTPIQAQTIPSALSGRDIVGIAQTGTGKTAAFALPILHQLVAKPQRPERKSCRVLVLSPTRELSGQILDSFNAYGRHLGINNTLAIGGVPMGRQVRALMNGVDVLVATPGRLLDLVQSNALRLSHVGFLVLDEADRMLDMGFIHDIRKIVAKLPTERQTLFFSATMPQQIADLARQMLRDPVKVAVTPAATTVERVAQRVIHVDRAGKAAMLADLLRGETVERTLVFPRTKHGADKVVRGLDKAGIASGISHVINYDLPNEPESYVHRIGRTARAGATGIAISLCDAEEAPYLRAIEKLIRLSIPSEGYRPSAHRPQHAAAGAREGRPNGHRPHGGRSNGEHARGDHPRGGHQPHNGGHSRGSQAGAHAHGRPAEGGHPGRNKRHRPQRGGQGGPSYGERPRQGHAHKPDSHGRPAGHDVEGIGGVGFLQRPVPARRDDAGRPPR